MTQQSIPSPSSPGLKAASVFTTRKLVDYTAAGPQAGSASFAVGIGSFPYLSDHGFQGMTVLPGTFFVEMALCVHLECLHAPMGMVKHVEFLNPVILADGDVTLKVVVGRPNDQTVQYTFHESTGQEADALASPPCAKLEIECGGVRRTSGAKPDFDFAAFQLQAEDLGEPAGFYRRLRENGNQYGPHFQSLRHVWRSGAEALGRLRIPRDEASRGGYHLHPVLLDGVAQLLSAFSLDQGRTFILQGIESVAILAADFPGEIWVHGRLRPAGSATEAGATGDLEVLDDSGAPVLQLQGVRFTYLERTAPEDAAAAAKTSVVIASTFTAEPVEDALQFWGGYLGMPVQVGFAPYNQVFQELLNPESQLRRNQDGINVVLLNLGDWAADGRSAGLRLDPGKAANVFGNLERHILPNGMEVAHLNRHETEYVYKEIFEDRCYLRHGIRLSEDATVIDIGANIGLFSLFVRSQSPRASVFSYEPSPIAFRALQANCEAYGPLLRPFNVGVSDRRGSAQLTFYEKSSVFSSFHSNAEEDRQAIKAVVANMVRGELGTAAESVDEYVEELMTDRMNRQTFECPLVSVSDIIRDNGLQRVNLLKVDAEKCELEILRGIDDSVWPSIDQVVVEVHDRTRQAVTEVQEILSRHGFQCAVEEENLLTGSGLFNVYAIRNESAPSPVATPKVDLQDKVDLFVQALDSFTRTAGAPTVLCLCPSGPRNSAGAATGPQLAASEKDLLGRVRDFPRVHVISPEAILARYPTAEFHDPHADNLGHIPYTPEGFAAIGSCLFRTIASLRRPPLKVIVLDCDNTLWQGACGEEGALAVTVTPAHRALQEFMIGQASAGMLLCLCSKNSEADVWAVFAQNPGMVLKREHLAGWRINWTPKSENLRALATELNLGPDSFIFLDDNPVECAEVRANCPAALTLQLPLDPATWLKFLDHVWAFDHLRATEEDRTRTQKVQENARRESYRGQVATLKDFIDGLQLQITIFEPARDKLGRVAQLTQRTNQFNFTTVRRSESEILSFLEQGNGRCLAVTVSDRFGDYGLVGLLLWRESRDCLEVDTFLLSCRVLGRGVEHQVLAELGRRAVGLSKQWVDLTYRSSGRNQPAGDFIQTVGAGCQQPVDGGAVFHFAAGRLAGLRYEPGQPPTGGVPTGEEGPAAAGTSARPRLAAGLAGQSEKFQRIAGELHHVRQIGAAIEADRLRTAGFSATDGSGGLPATLEGKLLGIWRRAIANPRIGVNDNFFEAGGTSLKAVQTVAAIRRELQLQVSIVNIFECPTVRLLAGKLEPGNTPGGSASEAMARGARRKLRAHRRG